MRTVYILLSCDTDPDRPGFLDGGTDRFTWRGMTEGIPAVKQLVRGVTDSRGRAPIFTWFLRADEQMQTLYGAYGAVVREQQALLRTLAESGDELGWHPHFWRRERDGRWYQEVEDEPWQLEMLRRGYEDLAAALPAGAPPASVRMGWAYHTTRTYTELERLGVRVDCSALPGYRTYRGTAPTRGENNFDWYVTPEQPFRPSRVDHRRAPRAGEAAFDLLEAPSFVTRSRGWAVVSALRLTRKTGDPGLLWDALRRPVYCINVTARAALFAPLVRRLRDAVRDHPGAGPILFSTQFHADELVPNRSTLYRLESLRDNVQALVRAAQDAGAAVEFIQARDVPARWAGTAT